MARLQIIVLVSLLLLPLASHLATADPYGASDHATANPDKTSNHGTAGSDEASDRATADSDETSDRATASSVKASDRATEEFGEAFDHATAEIDDTVTKVHKEKRYAIEGKIYCQSCKNLETDSIYGDGPVPYAKVRVTCKNHRDQVFYEKEYTANYYGYFYAELEGYSVMSHVRHLLAAHPLHSCKVKLVSSPVKSCNIPTTLNNGNTGASLRREVKKFARKDCDYEVYAAGPLAFHSALCHY